MVDEHDTTGNDGPDPWAEIDSAGGGATGDGFDIDAFTFDGEGEPAPAGEPKVGDDAAAEQPFTEQPFVEQPATDEPFADQSAGVTAHAADAAGGEQHGDGEENELLGSVAWDDPEPAMEALDRSAEQSADSFGLGEFSESSESGSEAAVAPVAAAAVAAAAVATRAATPRPAKRKKSGGIGQMISIVLGGAMAIPVTLGILVWGFGKDPFGTTKHVPDQLAFLLPAKFQRGGRGGGEDLGLPIPKQPRDRRPVNGAEPSPPASDPVVEPAATTPSGDDLPGVDPAADSPEPFVDPLDAPAIAPPPAVVPPAPPALDTTALQDAIAAAEAAAEAVRDVTDPADPARTPLLIEWYKRLAAVAEQFVLLEHAAADTGRALAGPPEGFKALHAAIAARADLRDELPRLGRMWLTASNRKGDGVVLQATFESARRAGPYWSTLATLQLPKGKTRQLVLVSRGEPAAVAGDPIVVTGVILGDGVVWAADVRGMGAGDSASGFGF
jgi:hypothetical protein